MFFFAFHLPIICKHLAWRVLYLTSFIHLHNVLILLCSYYWWSSDKKHRASAASRAPLDVMAVCLCCHCSRHLWLDAVFCISSTWRSSRRCVLQDTDHGIKLQCCTRLARCVGRKNQCMLRLCFLFWRTSCHRQAQVSEPIHVCHFLEWILLFEPLWKGRPVS